MQIMLHQLLADLHGTISDEKSAMIHRQMARKMLLLAADNTLADKPKAGAMQIKGTSEIRLLFQVLRDQNGYGDVGRYLKLLEPYRENEEFNMIDCEVMAMKGELDNIATRCDKIINDYLDSLDSEGSSKVQVPDWRIWDYLSTARSRLVIEQLTRLVLCESGLAARTTCSPLADFTTVVKKSRRNHFTLLK